MIYLLKKCVFPYIQTCIYIITVYIYIHTVNDLPFPQMVIFHVQKCFTHLKKTMANRCYTRIFARKNAKQCLQDVR